MVSLRGVVPLLLTGTSGLALLGFGVGGLSGMDPQLQRAARTVQLERSAPKPDRTTPDRMLPDVTVRDAGCPQDHHRAHHGDEV